MLEGTTLSPYVDVDAIALTHPNTNHVLLDEHSGPYFANAYFMATILDFMTCHNARPDAHLYLSPLKNKSDDAVALDILQDYLFAGQLFRSPLVVVDAATQEARYAEIALLPPYVRCHMTPTVSASGKATIKRSRTDKWFDPSAMRQFEGMCVDPLWLALVRNMKYPHNDNFTIPHSALVQSRANLLVKSSSPLNTAPILPAFDARELLCKCFCPDFMENFDFTLAIDAKLERIERGVEFRVETYKLEDEPGARSDRAAGWDIGFGHRVVYRTEMEARYEAQLAVANLSTSTAPKQVQRRLTLQNNLAMLRDFTVWYLL